MVTSPAATLVRTILPLGMSETLEVIRRRPAMISFFWLTMVSCLGEEAFELGDLNAKIFDLLFIGFLKLGKLGLAGGGDFGNLGFESGLFFFGLLEAGGQIFKTFDALLVGAFGRIASPFEIGGGAGEIRLEIFLVGFKRF